MRPREVKSVMVATHTWLIRSQNLACLTPSPTPLHILPALKREGPAGHTVSQECSRTYISGLALCQEDHNFKHRASDDTVSVSWAVLLIISL